MATQRENIARRGLLAWGAAAALPALSGCGYITPFRPNDEACQNAPEGGSPIIDMHCHILNYKDTDATTFALRHEFDSVLDPEWNVLGGLLVRPVLDGMTWTVMNPRDEYAWLKNETPNIQRNIDAYCQAAAERDHGPLYAAKNHQIFGMASNRARNAGRLISLFPQVDIFTPSMVDLTETEAALNSDPEERANVYSQIAIATLGRIMPMVSFSPIRAYHEERHGFGRRSLDMVRRCIEEKGFVGVKLHPSTGFSPTGNARFGCDSDPAVPWNPIGLERGAVYDRVLRDLFVYCRGAGVPILTHSGYGVAGNPTCMTTETRVTPEWQSNAPHLWELAIQDAKRATHDCWGNAIPLEADLAICMAHLAGGFPKQEDGRLTVHPWLQSLSDIMRRNPRVYTDMADQSEMFGPDNYSLRTNYILAFQTFLSQNPILAERLMYGTDWHMPGAAWVGRGYFEGMLALVPERHRRRTFGLNAVDFLGLRRGQQNRKRLRAFYERNKVPLEKVAWMGKLDALPRA